MGKTPLRVLAGLAVAALFLSCGNPGQATPSVSHHDLRVTLHPAKQSLRGTDTLRIRLQGASHLALALAENARVIGVSMAGRPMSFTFEGGRLRISVPEKQRKDELTLTVTYEASFRNPIPEDPVYTEDPSYGVTGVISPRGTFLLPGAGWYPEIPGSTPTFRLRVRAPDGIEAVTAGKRMERKTSGGQTISAWKMNQPLPGLALSAGRYLVRERDARGTPIYTYFLRASDHLSEMYLEATVGYLNLYNGLLGPYPFDKFAVVENFFPTGYGFPSYTLLGSTVIRLPFIVGTSLGHEVAHSWFGNGVLVDYRFGNWSEGLTTYLADYLYKELSSPEEGREYRLQILRDYATLVPPEKDFPLKHFTSRVSPSSRAVGYGKGAMVFHMARRMVGNDAFWNGLREVFREKLFDGATWDDFANALGRSGKRDLGNFFRQWVSRPGAPTLALNGVGVLKDDKGWEITGRLVQQGPSYDLQVPLHLETDGKDVETKIRLSGQQTIFALWSEAPPRRLVVDPEVDLFRRLDPAEIPATVNAVGGSTSLIVVTARGLPPSLLNASKVLLKALGHEEAPILREGNAPPSQLKEHDVLYLGKPEGGNYLPPLPHGLSVWPDGFTLQDQTYDAPTDVLFVVLPHPEGGGRVTALFLPLSGETASLAARKIPHYGKYSYLAFRGGVNRAKGTWPVVAPPTIHHFIPAEVTP